MIAPLAALRGKALVVALGVGLALSGTVYVQRARIAALQADLATATETLKTWERIQHADIGNGNPDDDLDWLRHRAR